MYVSICVRKRKMTTTTTKRKDKWRRKRWREYYYRLSFFFRCWLVGKRAIISYIDRYNQLWWSQRERSNEHKNYFLLYNLFSFILLSIIKLECNRNPDWPIWLSWILNRLNSTTSNKSIGNQWCNLEENWILHGE